MILIKNYFDTSTVEDVIKQVIKIKSQSKHFIERVFGTKNDPMHNNRARSGVSLENIKDVILSDKEHIYSSRNDSFVLTLNAKYLLMPTVILFKPIQRR